MRRRLPTPAATPPTLGEKKFRRVWLRGNPRNSEPYWYVWAHSRMGAINEMARRQRRPAGDYEADEE